MRTNELMASELTTLRAFLNKAFDDDFSDHDWDHCLGGVHVLASVEDELVSHAAVTDRVLSAGERAFRTGYVEGVATHPSQRGRGFGSTVMKKVNEIIAQGCELGGLATGSVAFYDRLGWELWRGPTGVDAPEGRRWTPEEDGSVMVLPTSSTSELDLTGPLICDWREGEVW